MTYNLFIDDYRKPNDVVSCLDREWVIARSAEQVSKIVSEMGMPDFISFDHDMTDLHYAQDYSDGLTGAHIAYSLCRFFGCEMPPYQVHSWNPEAPARIADAIEKAKLDIPYA